MLIVRPLKGVPMVPSDPSVAKSTSALIVRSISSSVPNVEVSTVVEVSSIAPVGAFAANKAPTLLTIWENVRN